VADLRAPTPSAAAELVVERKDDLVRLVGEGRMRLLRATRSRLGLERARLKGFSRDEGLLRLKWKLKQWRERMGQGRDALVSALERRPVEFSRRLAAARRTLTGFARLAELSRKHETIGRLASLLTERSRRSLDRRRTRLSGAAGRLELLSPLSVLARGYAVAYREGSTAPLLSAAAVRIGERIRVRLHEGELGAVVRGAGRSVETASKPQTPHPTLFPEDS
jgi:exodeoxyribonuclease VII large subunit